MTPPDLTWVARGFDGLSPRKINTGQCLDWALVVQGAYPEARLLQFPMFGGHAVVRLRGRYYDAESPRGVVDVRRLRFFRELLDEEPDPEPLLEPIDAMALTHYWDRDAASCAAWRAAGRAAVAPRAHRR